MPPPRTPLSRSIADLGEEAAMGRVNRENEDRLARAVANGIKPKSVPELDAASRRLDEMGKLPGWPNRDQAGESFRRVEGYSRPFDADESDPRRAYQSLGPSPELTQADIEGELPGGAEDGVGGPQEALSEADIIELRKFRDDRARSQDQASTRALLLEGINPDQAAEDERLASRAGVQPVQVEQDRETYRAAERAKEIDALAFEAPKVKSWISDPANFRVAHDDVQNLQWWESAGKMLGTPSFEESGQALQVGMDTAYQGLLGLGQIGTEINTALFGAIGLDVAKEASVKGGAAFRSERQRIARNAAANTPQGDTWLESGIYDALQSAPASIGALVTAVITRNPALGAITMGEVTGGQAYGEAEDAGKDATAKIRYALTQGGIEAATEFLPLKFLVGDLAKETPFFKALMKQAVAEGVGEQVATFTQDASTALELQPDKTLGEFMAERPEAAVRTLVASTLMSGVQTTIAKGVDKAAVAFDQAEQKRRSETLERTFNAMAQGAKDSKLLKRLPEKYREAVQQITKDGPLESVRVTPEALRELAQTNNVTPEALEQAFRLEPGSIAVAEQTGEDVIIPSANYATAMGTAKKEIGLDGNAIHTALAPNMRLRAEDFTPKEREAMQKVFEDEKDAGAVNESEQTFADSADRVREAVREQVAKTGMFNNEAASTQASIASEMVITLAERTGQDPEALWSEMGFAVSGEVGEEADTLSQRAGRKPEPIDDATLTAASTTLSANEFEAFKAAREGLTNEEIAVRMGGEDGRVTPTAVSVYLGRAREKGFETQKLGGGRPQAPETEGVIRMLARDVDPEHIANVMFPDRDREKAKDQVRVMRNKYKDRIDAVRSKLTLAQSSRDLDMSEPARMGRAREQGFDVDTPLYHGSSKDIREFQPSQYGKERGETAVFAATQPENIMVTGDTTKQAVYPIFARGKMFDPRNPEDVARVAAEIPGYRDIDERLADGHWQFMENYFGEVPQLRKALDKLGYDGMWVKEGSAWNLGVFDPKNIRGKFAKFDPSEEGSSKLLAQETRGSFTGQDLGLDPIIRLFESANLSTFVHEASHFYLTTLEKLARTENAHPFVTEQLAAIREWAGKHAEFEMYDAAGKITPEGREVQEQFAETFEAYLREGKAPSTGLRSVFSTLKAWLMRVYRDIASIGRRVNLNDEIRDVFDRMLATDEAIKAARQGMDRDSEAMAKALLDKGVITPKAFERTKARLAAARERAEAELMARLMEDYERSQKSWWKDEERQTRAAVTREIDQQPAQRAFAWLSGRGWMGEVPKSATDANADEIADALTQTAYDLNTPEARAEWVRTGTVQSGIPGETTDAKQWGFKLDDGTGIVVSIAPDPNGESVIEWTFLERLKAREEVTDLYKQDGPPLTVSQLKQLLARVAAIIETDMRDASRDAYTFTPATKAIGRINARLLKMIQKGPYEVIDFPWADELSDALILHADARLADNGKIIPRPENASRRLQWDSGARAEERQDDFYAEVDALPQPVGSRAGRPAGTGDDRTGTRPAELAYLDTDATDASLKALSARMIEDGVVPVILLFRTTSGRVIAFPGDNGTSGYHHDLAREVFGLGNLRLDHGVYNPRKWPTLAAMDAAGEVAWYGTSGTAPDAEAARPARVMDSGEALAQSGGDSPALKVLEQLAITDAEATALVQRAQRGEKLSAKETRIKQELFTLEHRASRTGQPAVTNWQRVFRGEPLAQSGDGWGPVATPPNLPPMRLDPEATQEQYGLEAVQKLPPAIAAHSEATAQAEVTSVGPDEAALIFGMHDGDELLKALRQGPIRDKLIRNETRRRMTAKHGDPFKDGTIMREAEIFARNEVQQRQFEIELEALAKAAGQFAAGNLAKQTAQESLRDKQVREVLNYGQWLILEQRWGKKALEAATKGKFDEAARFKGFQLVNLHMFREGRRLADQIEKTRKGLIDYGSKTKVARLTAAGADYATQMQGLLDDYMLRPESRKAEGRRQARGAWVKAQLAAIDPYAAYQDNTKSAAEQQAEAQEALERSAVLARLGEDTEAANFKSLTVADFLAVKDEADLIWRLATLKDRLVKEGQRRALSLAAGDIATEVRTNQPNEKPPEPIETDAPGEGLKRGALKYFAMHRTLQSLAHQFAGGKDGGVFWSYIVKPLNEAFAKLSGLRKQMGEDLKGLFSVYSKAEIARFYKERQHFASLGQSLTKQGRLAVALNWGNAKNRKRLMDSTGWDEAGIQEVLATLDKRDWDFLQATWDYLDTWFPEANRVHESVHGAPMDKEAPLEIATRFGIYRGGYYPIAFDPNLSSKSGQRKIEAETKALSGRIGVRNEPGFGKKRVEGKVTLPLKLSVLDVVTRHLDQVATSIATEEALFDAGRLVMHKSVEDAIIERHGRQVYNTIVNMLVTTKFGLEGASGVLAHLRNGATVVGLAWKVSTALLQPLGVTNSIVRVGGYWMAKGYARMGTDAATITSSADWIMQRSEFMRHRRQAQSPELAALRDNVKKTGLTPKWVTNSLFALMTNAQFYSVDMPTWYGAWYKAKAAGLDDADAYAQADQAVIDAQGGGELHATAAIQTGAGTKYAAALRLLTNFMSYMITTYNLATQRARNTKTPVQALALGFDMLIMLAVPVAGKMMLDAWTKGDDDDDDLWEKYGREQAAFLMSPFVGLSQIAGAARGDDAYGYRGPAGLGIFAEATRAGAAAAELDFDESFWRPANKTAGMVFHYPASQLDLTVRGSMALWNGETTNPAAIFFGPPPAN